MSVLELLGLGVRGGDRAAEIARVLESLPRPRGMSAEDWAALRADVVGRNDALLRAMRDPSHPARVNEYGGNASAYSGGAPFEWETSNSPYFIDTGTETAGHQIYTHNHPHEAFREMDDGVRVQAPYMLSGGDLNTPLSGGLGITSIEPGGGFGYALRGKRHGAIRLDDPYWNEVSYGAAEAARKRQPNMGFQIEHFGETPDDVLAAQMGLGEAMAKQRMLSAYGYLPATAEQRAALRRLRPAIDDARNAAYRSLHKGIHGTPYPFTPNALKALAGASIGGAGVLGALMSQRLAEGP